MVRAQETIAVTQHKAEKEHHRARAQCGASLQSGALGLTPPLRKGGRGKGSVAETPSSHLAWFRAAGDAGLAHSRSGFSTGKTPAPKAASIQTYVEMFLLCMFDLDLEQQAVTIEPWGAGLKHSRGVD